MEEKRENFSRKRQAVLTALQETGVHPSAEWIYQQLKPQYPDLSLATVYRNLNRFCQAGQAVRVGVVDGHERFDGKVSPHAHLICSCCGQVVYVWQGLPNPEELERIAADTGCQIQGASLIFAGLCPACSQEQECKDGTSKNHF